MQTLRCFKVVMRLLSLTRWVSHGLCLELLVQFKWSETIKSLGAS